MTSRRARSYRRTAKIALCGAAAWPLVPLAAALYVCWVAVVFELIDRWARRR